MKKADLIKKKIERFLIDNGCTAWKCMEGFYIAPNGHRFACETSSGIIAIFHRDAEWGRKSNFFEWIKKPLSLEKAIAFISQKLAE